MKKQIVNEMIAMVALLFILVICYSDILYGTKTFSSGGDSTIQTYAWMSKICNAAHNGEFAIWDFNQYGGVSFAGEIQTAPFYIGNLVFALIIRNITQHAVDLYLLAHFYFASLSMYVLLRNNCRDIVPSICGSVMFTYMGSVCSRAMGQANIFIGLTFLPMIILLYQKAVENEKIISSLTWSVGCGIALGTSFLAGHMQPYIHAVLALVLMCVVFGQKKKIYARCILNMMIAGIVSVLTCFGQLIAGFEYMGLSYRWISLGEPVRGWEDIPDAAYDLWAMKMEYIIDIVKDSHVIGDGNSLYISIVGLIFAAIGIYAFINNRKSFDEFIVILLLLSFVASFGKKNIIGMLLIKMPFFSVVREPARILFLYCFAVAAIASRGIDELMRYMRTRVGQVVCGGISFAILALLVMIGKNYCGSRLTQSNADKTANVCYQENELIEFLEKRATEDNIEGQCYRYACDTNEDTITPNIGNLYQSIFYTMGHRATMPISYFDYLGRNGWDWTGKLAEDLAIKYYISNIELDDYEERGYEYYGTICDKYIYIKKHVNGYLTIVNNNDGTREDIVVRNLNFKTNEVSFVVDLPETCTLRVSQMFYPGWKCLIDSNESSIAIDSDEFMLLSVPDGEHEITLIYNPYWTFVWCVMSACVALTLVILLLLHNDICWKYFCELFGTKYALR